MFRYGGLVFDSERELAVRFIDDIRAAEAAGVEVLDAWISVCAFEGLRGGLRVIAEREAGHATLLAGRLQDLGAPRDAALPGNIRAAALSRFGSPEVSDREKLAILITRYPTDGSVTGSIDTVCAQLHDDVETRELLRMIADGDRATVTWLRGYHGE